MLRKQNKAGLNRVKCPQENLFSSAIHNRHILKVLVFSSLSSSNGQWRIGRWRDFLSLIAINRKTLDDNDLNQLVASSGFSENKGLGEGLLSLAGS